MFNNIGTIELLIIGALVFMMFGGKKLPELTRGIGDAVREFRSAAKEA